MRSTEVIQELIARWNAGDLDRALELYAEDGEIRTGAHWPEHTTYRGRQAIQQTTRDWASMWQTIQIELDSLEEHGDKVVGTGTWVMRGAASGVDGRMPIFIVFTLRDGKIAVLEWFADRESAVADARGT